MKRNRRALVLTSESSRHPFRMSLPPHVLSPEGAARLPRPRSLNLGDWRDFLAAYCATFVAVTIFIS